MANYNDVKKEVAANVKAGQTAANQTAKAAYEASKAQAQAMTAKSKDDARKNYRDAKNSLSGASQTTLNKLETNYGRAVASASSAGTSAEAAAKQAYAKSTATNNENANKARGKNAYEMGKAQAQKEYSDKKQKQDAADTRAKIKAAQDRQTKELKYQANEAGLDRFKSQVGELETVKACNRLIKKLKKSKDPNKSTMLAYVRAHRAKLKEAKKSSGGGGGGGWHSWGGRGWRSYGGRSYNSGGNATDTEKLKKPKKTKTETSTNKSAYAKAAKKKSSGKNTRYVPNTKMVIKAKTGIKYTGKSGLATGSKSGKSVARTRASGSRHWHQ